MKTKMTKKKNLGGKDKSPPPPKYLFCKFCNYFGKNRIELFNKMEPALIQKNKNKMVSKKNGAMNGFIFGRVTQVWKMKSQHRFCLRRDNLRDGSSLRQKSQRHLDRRAPAFLF